MTMAYFDIVVLLFTWYVGILFNVAGIYIHILPLIAVGAAAIRLHASPVIVNISIHTEPVAIRTKK